MLLYVEWFMAIKEMLGGRSSPHKLACKWGQLVHFSCSTAGPMPGWAVSCHRKTHILPSQSNVIFNTYSQSNFTVSVRHQWVKSLHLFLYIFIFSMFMNVLCIHKYTYVYISPLGWNRNDTSLANTNKCWPPFGISLVHCFAELKWLLSDVCTLSRNSTELNWQNQQEPNQHRDTVLQNV